jgi:hypothetical protein
MRHAAGTSNDDGKERGEKDEKYSGSISDPEQDNRYRNPGDGTDGTQYLEHRIQHLVDRRIPAERQTQRDSNSHRDTESYGNTAQGVADVAPKHMLAQQLSQPFFHAEGRRKNLGRGPDDGEVPQRKKQPSREKRPEKLLPSPRFRK